MAWVIEQHLDIDAPPEVVWEVIADLPRYADWNPFCLECRSSLKPGEPIDMTVRLFAQPQHQREWVREYDAGTRFAYAMKPVPLRALSSYRSHEVRAGATGRTRYHSYFQLQGWLRPVVTGLLGRRLRTGFAGMSAAVARRAEDLWQARRAQRRA